VGAVDAGGEKRPSDEMRRTARRFVACTTEGTDEGTGRRAGRFQP
jgi:hypothetical protein